LRAADEAAGQRAGGLAVLVGDLAGHDGGDVALGALHQPTSAGGQVVAHLGTAGGQVVEVDEVDVGPVAGGEHAPVEQADRAGGVAGVLLHQVRQLETAPVAVAAPQREQRGGEAGVADRADVGAAVAQAGHGVGVGEHLAGRVEVAFEVVQERCVEEGVSLVGDQVVVDEVEDVDALAIGPPGEAVVGVRLVVRRVVEGVDAVEGVEQAALAPRLGPVGAGRLEEPFAERRGGEHRHLLGQRPPGDLAVDGVGEERVERALQAEQQAHRPRGDLGAHRDAVVVGLRQQVEEPPPVAAEPFDHRERQGPSRDLGHRAEQAELGVDVAEVGHDLEHAPAGGADGGGDADQLVGLGGERGRGLALAGAVVERARGGEAESAGGDALAGELGHGRDVVGGGGLAGGAALAHDVEAQGAVGHLERHVDVEAAGGDDVDEVGERLPRPGQALVEHDAGDVLDALHQLDEPLVVGGADRGEADAAVAGDDRGDPVPRRRDHALVPRGLAVVVGVDVDEAGGDQQAVGVDRAPGGAVDLADGGDHPVGDGDVGGAGRGTGAVDDGAAADDQVMRAHGRLPLGGRGAARRRRAAARCGRGRGRPRSRGR
jgi:hypothetical protein